MKKKWAVIGAGNGGQATAGHLALMGYEVAIYDVSEETVKELNEAGGIRLSGVTEGFGQISFASTEIGKVMEGAEVVMVVLPSIYVASIARKCAPYIRDGQIIALHPGSCFAPMEFYNVAKQEGCTADYLLGGTSTLLFACRIIHNGEVNVFGRKDFITGAALPASRNQEFEAAIQDAFPQIKYLSNVIEVGFDNLNAILHPGPALLNTGRIDCGETFEYYKDGCTPNIIAFSEKIDAERINVSRAFHINLPNAYESFKKEYASLEGDNLYELIHANRAYDGLLGPKDIHNRFLMEDVPYALVPMKAFAKFTNVETPGIDAIITMSYMLLDGDLDEGRTGKAMGLERFSSMDELFHFVNLGG